MITLFKLWLSYIVIVCVVKLSVAVPCYAHRIPATESRDVDYDKDDMIMEDMTIDTKVNSQVISNNTRGTWTDTQEKTTLSLEEFLTQIVSIRVNASTIIKNTHVQVYIK